MGDSITSDEPLKITKVSQNVRLLRLQRQSHQIKLEFMRHECKKMKKTSAKLVDEKKRLLIYHKHLIAHDYREEKEHLIFLNLEPTLLDTTLTWKKKFQAKAEELEERQKYHANTIKHYQNYWKKIQKQYRRLPKGMKVDDLKKQCAEIEEIRGKKEVAIAEGRVALQSVKSESQKAIVKVAEKMRNREIMNDAREKRKAQLKKIEDLKRCIVEMKKQAKVAPTENDENEFHGVNLSEFDVMDNALDITCPSPESLNPSVEIGVSQDSDLGSVLSFDMNMESQVFGSYDEFMESTPYETPVPQIYSTTPTAEEEISMPLQTSHPESMDAGAQSGTPQPEDANATLEKSDESNNSRYEKSPEPEASNHFGGQSEVNFHQQNNPQQHPQRFLDGSQNMNFGLMQRQAETQSHGFLHTQTRAMPEMQLQGFPSMEQRAMPEMQLQGFPSMEQRAMPEMQLQGFPSIEQRALPQGFPLIQGQAMQDSMQSPIQQQQFPGMQQKPEERVKQFGFFNFGSSEKQPSSSIFNLF